MQTTPIIDGVREIELQSWQEFFSLTNDEFSKAPAFVYRGQTNYVWPLESSLDRHQRKYPKRKNLCGGKPEFFDRPPLTDSEHLAAFRRALRGRRGPTPPTLSDDECWALGQHHGLKTPLLDMTRSPYVALFFAFDEIESGEYRGVFALSTSTIEDPPVTPPELIRLVSPEGDANFRLISQAALFIKLPRQTNLENYVRTYHAGETHGATLTKIKIPNKDRTGCLVALNKMNVNYMTLFPDIDGAARHVNSLWQPGHEDSIAWV